MAGQDGNMGMARPLAFLVGALALGLIGCRGKASPAAAAASASSPSSGAAASASAPPVAVDARLRELLAAEHRRDSRAVSSEDVSHRDVRVRRAAVRALARIADARARAVLKRTLADEDPQIVAFSAYGLGLGCRDAEPEVVRALSSRAATLLSRAAPSQAPAASLDPLSAIADALGRCGSGDAERTLRAWLTAASPLAESAALGLGRIASQKGRLDDSSLVALLDVASRPTAPLEHALFAFTRLSGLGQPVQTRLLEVARQNVSGAGLRRTLALRALATAGDEGAATLAAAVQNRALSGAERAEAARSLGRLGAAGQKALQQALAQLLPPPDQALSVMAADYGLWTALLHALAPPVSDITKPLERLAELPLEGDASARRRTVSLRCRAAALLAGRATLSPRLRACDPDPEGRAGKLATLSVLDQGKLTGARFARFQELTAATDPLVRQEALRLLGGHPEAAKGPELITRALRSNAPGDVATAAGLLAQYPERAGRDVARESDAPTPDPVVIAALTAAFDSTAKSAELEVHAAVMDAAAALQLLGLKSRIESSCSSDLPSVREHAQKALRLLGDRQRTCSEFQPAKSAAPESSRPVLGKTTLELDTEAGALTLELDPELGPVAVTRVVELAREGFYDGMAVHRVVPGFVVQFGDGDGDGFGGASRPPLRCETAPMPFPELGVAMALGGRDTAVSQVFVALGRFPHLDGEYTVVGRARGPWHALAEGDVIRKVRVNADR